MPRRARTVLLTVAALAAFAGNSLLCRLALAAREIDAASFTSVRLASGAVVLALLSLRRRRGGGSWVSALVLFVYAAPFSYAYLELGAGVGALILFGAVQATMMGAEIAGGARPPILVWTGLAVALAGLTGLTLPGATAPPLAPSLLMAGAGVAWGVYSLRGRGAPDALAANAANFARSVPFAAVLVAAARLQAPLHATPRGLVLAVLAGAVTSGVGYSVWYAALRGLQGAQAAVLQLVVPVIAALGGVTLLGEQVTARLLLGGGAILGGVALAIITARSSHRTTAARR